MKTHFFGAIRLESRLTSHKEEVYEPHSYSMGLIDSNENPPAFGGEKKTNGRAVSAQLAMFGTG